MTTKQNTQDQIQRMESRFTILRANLDYIANQFPRSQVLYPMMNRVIYQDFEVLIATTIQDADPANDLE